MEIAAELLKMGMTVVAIDLQDQLLAELPKKLEPAEKLDCRAMDVTDSEGLTSVIDQVAEKYGHLDVLVNNAGITRDGLLLRMDDADWELVLKVNLTSAFIGTREIGRAHV